MLRCPVDSARARLTSRRSEVRPVDATSREAVQNLPSFASGHHDFARPAKGPFPDWRVKLIGTAPSSEACRQPSVTAFSGSHEALSGSVADAAVH